MSWPVQLVDGIPGIRSAGNNLEAPGRIIIGRHFSSALLELGHPLAPLDFHGETEACRFRILSNLTLAADSSYIFRTMILNSASKNLPPQFSSFAPHFINLNVAADP
jgi:hypothetical protein